MKTKRLRKKLVFRKNTIANLGIGEMNGLKGGDGTHITIEFPTCNCPTRDITGIPFCLRCPTERCEPS